MIFLHPLLISSYWLKRRRTLYSPFCLSKSWSFAITVFITFFSLLVVIHCHLRIISLIIESPPWQRQRHNHPCRTTSIVQQQHFIIVYIATPLSLVMLAPAHPTITIIIVPAPASSSPTSILSQQPSSQLAVAEASDPVV